MKKLVVLLVLVLSLCACGNWEIEIRNPYDSSEESSESSSIEESEESSASEESESIPESEPESESEPEPEKEPRPDSEFGIEPATEEEVVEFADSAEAIGDLAAFAAWIGENDIENPKNVFSSYVLWWFGEELYEDMGGEEALYEDEAFFRVDVELAEKYFKRHFGFESENIKDGYNFDKENGNYKVPVSGGGTPNKFLSAQVIETEGNRVRYCVLLLLSEDETGRTFGLTETVCDIIKDSEGMYLRFVSNKVTEEFGESSFEEQAKYLTVRIVENLGGTYIANGVRVTDSRSVFEFICQMQASICLGERFDRNSPYIGDFYKDGEGYHFPIASMKKVAKEIFGIGNFVVSPGENFIYDEEKKEYVSGLEWGMDRGATAADLLAFINGDIYTVRFTLMVIESVDGDPEWVAKDKYKMNFRLMEDGYLRFIGFDKA